MSRTDAQNGLDFHFKYLIINYPFILPKLFVRSKLSLDLPQVSLEWVLIGYIQFIMRSVLNLKRRKKTDQKINWIYPKN